VFSREYLEAKQPYQYVSHHLSEDSTRPDEVEVTAEIAVNGVRRRIVGVGNGPIDAFVRGLAAEVKVMDYHEHSIGSGANATAVSYIEMRIAGGASHYGVGMDSNIVTASFKAILSGLNRSAARAEAQRAAAMTAAAK
jgi:2-isopropylmalate synthase